jgi:hypothetical protein
MERNDPFIIDLRLKGSADGHGDLRLGLGQRYHVSEPCPPMSCMHGVAQCTGLREVIQHCHFECHLLLLSDRLDLTGSSFPVIQLIVHLPFLHTPFTIIPYTYHGNGYVGISETTTAAAATLQSTG